MTRLLQKTHPSPLFNVTSNQSAANRFLRSKTFAYLSCLTCIHDYLSTGHVFEVAFEERGKFLGRVRVDLVIRYTQYPREPVGVWHKHSCILQTNLRRYGSKNLTPGLAYRIFKMENCLWRIAQQNVNRC